MGNDNYDNDDDADMEHSQCYSTADKNFLITEYFLERD